MYRGAGDEDLPAKKYRQHEDATFHRLVEDLTAHFYYRAPPEAIALLCARGLIIVPYSIYRHARGHSHAG